MTLGLTDGTYLGGSCFLADGRLGNNQSFYGKSVGTAPTGTAYFQQNRSIGITTDPTKSGIICDNDLNIKYIIKY